MGGKKSRAKKNPFDRIKSLVNPPETAAEQAAPVTDEPRLVEPKAASGATTVTQPADGVAVEDHGNAAAPELQVNSAPPEVTGAEPERTGGLLNSPDSELTVVEKTPEPAAALPEASGLPVGAAPLSVLSGERRSTIALKTTKAGQDGPASHHPAAAEAGANLPAASGKGPRKIALRDLPVQPSAVKAADGAAADPRPSDGSGVDRTGQPYYLVPFSAKRPEALNQKLQDLLEWLNKDGATATLENISYTLQVGRSHFTCRAALVVNSRAELLQKLAEFCEAGTTAALVVNAAAAPAAEEENSRSEQGNRIMQALSASRCYYDEAYRTQLMALARLYVAGYDPDWSQIYHGRSYRRISLPAYPFVRERYWLPEGAAAESASPAHGTASGPLHYLIDLNESTLEEQCFTKELRGSDFFLRDHLVGTGKVLPGVVYLEMARAAGNLARKSAKVVKITDIVWSWPIKLSEGETSRRVRIRLFPTESQPDRVDYEVSSLAGERRFLHGQGTLWFGDPAAPQPAAETMDIPTIQARCPEQMTGNRCYEWFEAHGLNLGPSFRSIRELRHNDREAIARLELPEQLRAAFGEMQLHPTLMDGALEVVMGLVGNLAGEGEAISLPFALDEVEWLAPLPPKCYSYAKLAGHYPEAPQGDLKFDVTILNEDGMVLLKLQGFSVRAARGAALPAPAEAELEELYYSSFWEAAPAEPGSGSAPVENQLLLFDQSETWAAALRERLQLPDERVVVVRPGAAFREQGAALYEIRPGEPDDYQQLLHSLSQRELLPDRIIHRWSGAAEDVGETTVAAQLEQGLYSLFQFTKGWVTEFPRNQVQLLYIYPFGADGPDPLAAALGGFAKTVPLENSKLSYKTLGMSAATEPAVGVERILQEFGRWDHREVEVSYQNEQRLVRRLRPVALPAASPASLLKEQGVYLITGGLGALGLIFAQQLARTVPAKLALVGRSAITPEQAGVIRELEELGAEVLVLQADVSDRTAVEQCVARVKERFQRIDGVIHAAGTLRDAYLVKKTKAEMAAVLGPKVAGVLNLDQATAAEPLDFFVLFSSIAALLGNPGQCDYAFANAFLDQFAAARARRCALQQRHGKTLAINWPLWQDGGMQVDAATAELFAGKFGLRALDTPTGWNAFLQGLQFDGSQILLASGRRQRFEQALEGSNQAGLPERPVALPVDARQGLEQIQHRLAGMVHQILKIKVQDLSIDKDLGEYGFNSLTFTEFANQVNRAYQLAVTPARFFEYPTIRQFAQFLWDEYPEVFAKLAAPEQIATPVGDPGEVIEADDPEPPVRQRFIVNAGAEQPRRAQATGNQEPIAIIGMSGVMPQSEDLDAFWENLLAKRDLITEIPPDRWDWREWYGEPNSGENKTHIKWGGFMKAVDQFDPLFFGISPREAEYMDPQQRIFLETVWQTIEDSGYKVSDLSGAKVGLFVGVSTMDYMELMKEHGIVTNAHTATGLSHCILANRISYLFNFCGPSEPIDTACSSSLIAIHRAVESIKNGDCELAIAGGVNVILSPTLYISFGKAGMLSPDGRCRTFDKQANGYARGEGSGAILLKPLSKAVADGDHIYAVIKGTAVNHGGHASSLTAPNPNAQADLLITAYEKARFDPSTVSYIEAHGTGTNLGDPIEINGLKKAFAELYRRWGVTTVPENRCGIGTVKTNIGHLETAAGIAGVLKVLLALKHQQLPGNVNFEELNPYIQISGSPFYIVADTREWPRLQDNQGRELPRRAGVSSFGFGGANAHVVLEEYVNRPAAAQSSYSEQLFVLSAKSEERLRLYAERLLRFVESHFRSEPGLGNASAAAGETTVRWEDFIYTLQVGREAFEERLALLVASPAELLEQLTAFVAGKEDLANLYRGNAQQHPDLSRLIGEGREGEAYTELLVKENNLAKLAQLWVLGVAIDWRKLQRGARPKRVALPGYPLERKRYWFDSYQKQSGSTTVKSVAAAQSKYELAAKSSNGKFIPAAGADDIWAQAAQAYQGDEVSLEIVGGNIALVKMEDRTNKNMFSAQMVAGLIAKFAEIKQNEQIKVVVVTGYDNVFCMGGTQDQLLGIAEQRAQFTDIPFLYRGLLDADIPVIAAIQGHASGGGLLFGLYADIVVLAEEAVYSAVFTKYGFTPGMGATFILKERFGPNLAVEMMYTAKSYRGEELKERGVSVLVRESRKVVAEALATARLLAEKPRHTLKILKQDLSSRILSQLDEVLARETAMHDQSFRHPEVRQRITKYFNLMQAGPAETQPEAAVAQAHGPGRPLKLSLKMTGVAAGEPPVTGVERGWDELTVGRRVVAILGEVLHLPESRLTGDASFKDLGVDSISAVEVVRDLNQAFNLNLDTVTLYDYATIAALVKYLVETLEASPTPAEAGPEPAAEKQTIRPGGKVVLARKAAADARALATVGPEGWQQTAAAAEPDYVAVEEPQSANDAAGWGDLVNAADAELQIYRKVVALTCQVLHIAESGWKPESSFKDMGVDSISGVEIIRDLNKLFGLNLETVTLYECATAASLAKYILGVLQAAQGQPVTAAAGAAPEPSDSQQEAELIEILKQLQSGELELNEADQLTEVDHGKLRSE